MRPIALHGHEKAINHIKYNREGDLLFSCAREPNGGVQVWYTDDGERLGSYEGHNGAINSFDVNFHTTLVATASADSSSKIYRACDGTCLTSIDMPAPLKAVGFGHGDKLLMAGTAGVLGNKPSIRLFKLPDDTSQPFASPREEATFVLPQQDNILCAQWGPTNEHIYLSTEAGSVIKYNVEKMCEEARNSDHTEQVKNIRLSHDYTHLISASRDGTAKVMSTQDLNVIREYVYGMEVNCADISSRYSQVLLGGGVSARDVTTTDHAAMRFESKFYHKIFGDELGQIGGHFSPVNTLCFKPDGSGFATGGEDGMIRMHAFDESYFKASDEIEQC